MHLFYLKDSAAHRVDGSLGHEGADLFSCQRRALDSATQPRSTAENKNYSEQEVYSGIIYVFLKTMGQQWMWIQGEQRWNQSLGPSVWKGLKVKLSFGNRHHVQTSVPCTSPFLKRSAAKLRFHPSENVGGNKAAMTHLNSHVCHSWVVLCWY